MKNSNHHLGLLNSSVQTLHLELMDSLQLLLVVLNLLRQLQEVRQLLKLNLRQPRTQMFLKRHRSTYSMNSLEVENQQL